MTRSTLIVILVVSTIGLTLGAKAADLGAPPGPTTNPAIAAAPLPGPTPIPASGSAAVSLPAPPGAGAAALPGVSTMVEAIQAVQHARSPKDAVAAYARGLALDRNDIKLHQAYMQTMVAFDVPDIAVYPARIIIATQPDNGLAWGVMAYEAAKQGDLPAATTDVAMAVDLAPADQFVLHIAGQVLAWYDAAPARTVVPASIRSGLDDLRPELNGKQTFVDAYHQTFKALHDRAAGQAPAAAAPAPAAPAAPGAAPPAPTAPAAVPAAPALPGAGAGPGVQAAGAAPNAGATTALPGTPLVSNGDNAGGGGSAWPSNDVHDAVQAHARAVGARDQYDQSLARLSQLSADLKREEDRNADLVAARKAAADAEAGLRQARARAVQALQQDKRYQGLLEQKTAAQARLDRMQDAAKPDHEAIMQLAQQVLQASQQLDAMQDAACAGDPNAAEADARSKAATANAADIERRLDGIRDNDARLVAAKADAARARTEWLRADTYFHDAARAADAAADYAVFTQNNQYWTARQGVNGYNSYAYNPYTYNAYPYSAYPYGYGLPYYYPRYYGSATYLAAPRASTPDIVFPPGFFAGRNGSYGSH